MVLVIWSGFFTDDVLVIWSGFLTDDVLLRSCGVDLKVLSCLLDPQIVAFLRIPFAFRSC